jgi:hypothetical protein
MIDSLISFSRVHQNNFFILLGLVKIKIIFRDNDHSMGMIKNI